jgi:hypothetical protein
MADDWRTLRVGDLIRIVRFPSEWENPNWHIDPSTRRLFKKLIGRKRPLRIAWIDENGCPWIQGRHDARERRLSGGWTGWILGIDDDSWVRVRRRAAKQKSN